jgi:sugar porter (SP) family MFS transporter
MIYSISRKNETSYFCINYRNNTMTSKDFNRSFVYAICFVSAMGGLLFGYDWVVIGGAKPFYELYFNLTGKPDLQGWTMSVALLGCLIGAVTAGFLADRYGRKKMLIAAAVLFVVSGYATGAVSTFSFFILARFFGGIGIGIASDLSPMYIAEISPARIRGKLVSINQLTIVIGILGAQITNWLIAQPIPETYSAQQILLSWNGQWAWRWMFWAEAFPAALFLILLFFIPESPRWLMMAGRKEGALKVMSHIFGEQQAQKEYEAVMQTAQTTTEKSGGLRALFAPSFRKVLLIGIVLAFFQQWCGTNVIFNYAQEIFQSAGFTLNDVMFNIVITGIANLAFTFVAIYTVDRIGRRMLMLIGAGGLAGIYLIVGLSYFFHIHGILLIVLVVLAIGCYAMSLGPVTWVLLSEIFPNKIRGVAMAVSTFSLWVGCFLLTYTFPLLNSALGSSGTFWIYSGICIAGFVFIYKLLPETKGKSLEALEDELCKK